MPSKNKIKFAVGSGLKLSGGSYKIESFKVSDGKSANVKTGVYNIKVSNDKTEGELEFEIDRKNTKATADWFNARIPELSTTFAHAAGELNFALLGTLVLRFTDGTSYTFAGVSLAQGHSGTSNNWWFGGATCINIGGNKVDCIGVNASGAKWSFHFRRGGTGNSVSTIAVTRIGLGYINNGVNPNWMGKIQNGALSLRELSIPGTHDSGTKNVSNLSIGARCQNHDIFRQLNDGIRFFDIRLKKSGDMLNLYHGIYSCSVNLGEVLVWFRYFLYANPGETILMCVKKEGGDSIASQFNKYIKTCEQLFLKDSKIPTLNKARGKIVLFKRFESGMSGIEWYDWKGDSKEDWPDNAAFDITTPAGDKFRVYDKYNFSDTNKKSVEVQNLLLSSANSNNKNILYATFNSIAYQANTRTPYQYAWGGNGVNPAMNPSLEDFLKRNSGIKRWGIVILDFYYNDTAKNNDIVNMIVNSNFGGWSYVVSPYENTGKGNRYCINMNPNRPKKGVLHREMHKDTCGHLPKSYNRFWLGIYLSPQEAIHAAR
ncbi:MAG: phosphatidylinositol-specific phospholipase C, partial [Endomicrobia bacterium]|nr:phosphatidylinositol-specific phospholipase C [Endomicrobiia bacterium]